MKENHIGTVSDRRLGRTLIPSSIMTSWRLHSRRLRAAAESGGYALVDWGTWDGEGGGVVKEMYVG